MNLHLAEIATQVAPGAHAALLVDQAGWHLSGGLVVPPNIALIPLPAKCPELNPQENVWQFMRENWLSKQDLQILQRHRRPLLRRMEQPHRPAMADHVDRYPRLGLPVVICKSWYKISKETRFYITALTLLANMIGPMIAVRGALPGPPRPDGTLADRHRSLPGIPSISPPERLAAQYPAYRSKA